MVECHDAPAAALNEALDEFHPEPSESVAAGSHKLDALSAISSFQYGVESAPFVVESASNVGNDFGVWAALSHEGDLPVKAGLPLDA